MTTQDKREPSFEDTDLLPFGKYKGVAIQDIPISYLQWFWENIAIKVKEDRKQEGHRLNVLMLSNYIWNSQDALRMELPDWIIK